VNNLVRSVSSLAISGLLFRFISFSHQNIKPIPTRKDIYFYTSYAEAN
jgi:hypothetical protein